MSGDWHRKGITLCTLFIQHITNVFDGIIFSFGKPKNIDYLPCYAVDIKFLCHQRTLGTIHALRLKIRRVRSFWLCKIERLIHFILVWSSL